MRKLTAFFFILILLVAACSADPVTDPSEPGGVDDPGKVVTPPDNNYPKPIDVLDSDISTEMTGWVLEYKLNEVTPLFHKDMLIFLNTEGVTAVAVETGKVQWMRTFPDGWRYDLYGESSKPEGNTLTYLVSNNKGNRYKEHLCLDTGKVILTEIDSDAYFHEDSHYLFSSADTLVKISNASGERVWEASVGESLNEPTVRNVLIEGGTVFLTVHAGDWRVYALNLADGELLWKFNGTLVTVLENRAVLYEGGNGHNNTGIISADAATGGDPVRIGENLGKGSAFTWKNQLFLKHAKGLRRINPLTGELVWELTLPENTGVSPCYPLEGLDTPMLWIYVDGDKADLRAINLQTGQDIIKYSLEQSEGFLFSIGVAEDLKQEAHIYFSDRDRHLIVVNSITGKKVWDLQSYMPDFATYGDSKYLVLYGMDELQYHDLATGVLEYTVPSPGVVTAQVGDGVLLSDRENSRIMLLTPHHE